MPALYLGNEFHYQTPPLRFDDGRLVAPRDVRIYLVDASGGEISRSTRAGTPGLKPGSVSVTYTKADVNRLVRQRVNQTVNLVIDVAGRLSFTVPLPVKAIRPPGAV